MMYLPNQLSLQGDVRSFKAAVKASANNNFRVVLKHFTMQVGLHLRPNIKGYKLSNKK